MYEYEEFIPINKEEILKRVSQEEIIEMALGYKPVLYQRMRSPIKIERRGYDNTPDSRFEFYNNTLFFIDFGDQPTHRVVFKFIADFYNVTFIDALRLINDHFELGLGSGNKAAKPKPVIYTQGQVFDKEKQKTDIIYKPRPFGLKDKAFWKPYQITKNQLIEDEVFAAIWYKFYSVSQQQIVVIRPPDITYIYTGFKGKVKIYRPNHNRRFITNCSENDIGNINNIPTSGENLIITKSYKDCRVVTNQDLIAIWFQNEGCVPSNEILIDLCERFDNIYVWFDNDEAGIRAAFKIVAAINSLYPEKALPIWLPEELLPLKIKDPSDLIKKSPKELKEFIVNRGLYGRYSQNNT